MMDLAPSLYSYSVIFNVPPYLVFVILVTRVIRWGAGPWSPGTAICSQVACWSSSCVVFRYTSSKPAASSNSIED